MKEKNKKDTVQEAIDGINQDVPGNVCIASVDDGHIGIFNASASDELRAGQSCYGRFSIWCVASLLRNPEMIVRSAKQCSVRKLYFVAG